MHGSMGRGFHQRPAARRDLRALIGRFLPFLPLRPSRPRSRRPMPLIYSTGGFGSPGPLAEVGLPSTTSIARHPPAAVTRILFPFLPRRSQWRSQEFMQNRNRFSKKMDYSLPPESSFFGGRLVREKNPKKPASGINPVRVERRPGPVPRLGGPANAHRSHPPIRS